MKEWLKRLDPGEVLVALVLVIGMIGFFTLSFFWLNTSNSNQTQLIHSQVQLDNSFGQLDKSFMKMNTQEILLLQQETRILSKESR